MSERLAESDKKPPLRLLVIRNGMPSVFHFETRVYEHIAALFNFLFTLII